MGRDPKTGRFLPGNQLAVGNRGNCKPKWGNKNALKHGFYRNFILPTIQEDGSLFLYKTGINPVVISPEGFFLDEEGAIWVHDDIISKLEKMGFVPDWL
jgi:hypothetical protein